MPMGQADRRSTKDGAQRSRYIKVMGQAAKVSLSKYNEIQVYSMTLQHASIYM